MQWCRSGCHSPGLTHHGISSKAFWTARCFDALAAFTRGRVNFLTVVATHLTQQTQKFYLLFWWFALKKGLFIFMIFTANISANNLCILLWKFYVNHILLDQVFKGGFFYMANIVLWLDILLPFDFLLTDQKNKYKLCLSSLN